MSDLLKVEISIVKSEGSVWQWLGQLSEAHMKALCSVADDLSDIDTDSELKELNS